MCLVGYQGVSNWKTLKCNQSINDEMCIKKSQEMTDLTFLYDNARSHLAKLNREKFLELDTEVLPHPLYSSDLAMTSLLPIPGTAEPLEWQDGCIT